MTSISTSAFFDRSANGIAALRARAEKLQGQIGGGERLTRSSDDPVGAARLRTLMRSEAHSEVDMANANRATADLTLADETLTTFADYITRVKELATQAANGTLSAAQRSGIGAEIAQIHGSLVALANSRDSAGHAMFGGEATGDAYAMTPGGAAYIGTAGAGELSLGEGQSVSRGLTGPEFLDFTSRGVPTNLMAAVKDLADALQGAVADPRGYASDALTTLGDGLESVTTAQTLLGARLAWIDLTNERRETLGELRAGEEAEIGATDIGATVAELQQVMLVLEASQASFARLAGLSLFDVIR